MVHFPKPHTPTIVDSDYQALLTHLRSRGLLGQARESSLAVSIRRAHRGCFALAVWDSALPFKRNPARSQLRQARLDAISCIPLALSGEYKAAALLERSILEECLSYVYYFHHPVEFRWTLEDPKFIQTFREFTEYATRLQRLPRVSASPDLIPQVRELYWQCSSEVHGRIRATRNSSIVLTDARFRREAWDRFADRLPRICALANMLLYAFHRDQFERFRIPFKTAVQMAMMPKQWRACLDS